MVAYGLDPPAPRGGVAFAQGCSSISRPNPRRPRRAARRCRSPLHQLWSGTACSAPPVLSLMPINQILWTRARSSTICLDVLGVELCDAAKLIRECPGGKSECSFGVCTYAFKTFAQQTPLLKPSPLLDGSDVWKVPRDEVLYVDVEIEPSFRLPTDKGSRGLAAMIKCCLTDEERLQLIQTAGKGLLETRGAGHS